MAFEEVAQSTIRGTYYDKVVKGFADRAYKFKQAVTISTTGAWTNYFYRGSTGVLAGQTGNSQKGLPRGADFPQASISWERVSSVIEKYGLEENIPWEDIISDEIDVETRTLMKIAEGVAKAVDDSIWDTLTENRTTTLGQISSMAITGATGKYWDVASAAIIDDLLQAQQKIAENNYPTTDLMLFVSPKDKRSIMNYLAEKGAQFPMIATGVVDNGVIGKLAGMTIIESNSVTASYALVVVPKRCATWKELVPLSTDSKEDKFKSKTYRAVELGVTQLTDPKCCVLIKGTQSPY
jgi:hypothetical protein